MIIVTYALFTFACSLAMSTVAFLVGRCGRKLPIDGMLPRVVHSARFGPESHLYTAPGNSGRDVMS